MSRRIDRKEKALRVREVRCSYVSVPVVGRVIASPDAAATILSAHFQTISEPVEVLVALYLNSRNQLLAVEQLYRGTINLTTVSCRDAIRTGLLLNAATVIIAHSHPSGDPAPSAEDLSFTRKLADAARLMGIELADHLILGFHSDGSLRYLSLKQRGAM